MIIHDVETPKSKSQEMWDKILVSPISLLPLNPDLSSLVAGGLTNIPAGGDVKEHLKNLIASNIELYGGNNATPYTFQEPISPIGTTMFPSQLKSNVEEQYSNIQEEMSKLTGIYNRERKERAEIQKKNAEIQKEKDKEITKLKNEIQQLNKKLAKAKATTKSYKDELKLKDGYSKSQDDIDDLKVRMTTAEVELGIKKEGK